MIFGAVLLATIATTTWFLLGGEGLRDKIKDGWSDGELSFKTNAEDIEEVENKHGDIRNLEGLNIFINNIKNDVKSNLDVISYGIEGQKVTETLTFNGDNLNVYRSVDGDFIEEFQCDDLVREESLQGREYVLKQCTGNFTGETVLLSVPKEE